MNLFFRA